MAHIHSVYDTDKHFTLEPDTRELVNQNPNKSSIMQHDHNSERITFEMPKVIDGHDMLTCNEVEVHYLNIDAQTKATKKGLYTVEDLQEYPGDPNICVLSWLVSENATQLVGPLNFRITFKCATNGNVDYRWSTKVYSKLAVSDGINNTDYVMEEYVDIIAQWDERITALEQGGATPEQIESAVNKYLDENPVEVSGVVKTVNGNAPDESGNVEITVPGGGSGEPGEPGGYYTPTVTQTDANTMKVSYAASKDGMAAVADQTITLPAGAKGDKGDKGDTGATGATGANGVSPTVAVSKTGKVTTLTITDANGTKTATINDGEDGASGGSAYTIPAYWQTAVDNVVNTVKSLQVGKNCITFPFFSDNHQRNGYAGMLIAEVMKRCNIPYCFYGGDSISNGYIASEAVMIAQDKAFDESMSYIPNGRFCRTVGNHDGYWYDGTNKYYYDHNQVYELFLREESVAQNKRFGGNGTYYYVDDLASKVRFVVLNTNVHRDASGNIVGKNVEDEQLDWIRNKALNFEEDGWAVVIISHQPLSNHYHANISNASEVRAAFTESGVDIVGCFSGHIHRDRIYTGVAVNTTDDSEGAGMGFKQVTITSDHTTISYDDATKHTVAEDALSHAIDFVTINRDTKTVNLTRLGIGNNRAYSYDNVILYSITNTLTNVTNSNGRASVEEGQAYTATLTASSGYELSTVNVTMGGADVTSSVYSNGTIDIASVTGDIVITATATKTVVDPSYTNLADLTDTSDNNWTTGYRLNSSGVSTGSTAIPAPMVTNYVACSNGDVIRVKGLTLGGFNCSIYKGNKVNVSSSKPTFPGTATASWTAEMEGADVYKFTVTNAEATYMRFSGVPVGAASDIIITKNEPIT